MKLKLLFGFCAEDLFSTISFHEAEKYLIVSRQLNIDGILNLFLSVRKVCISRLAHLFFDNF